MGLFDFFTGKPSQDKFAAMAKAALHSAGVLESQLALPKDYATAKTRLLPIIRNVLDEGLAQLHTFPGDNGDTQRGPVLASRLLCADLMTGLGYDSDLSIQRIAQTVLADWGVTFEQALEDAINNLRDQTTDKWHQLGEGTYASAWEDHYDLSRVLLRDCLYRLPLAGEPVVLLPTRTTLLVTGSNNLAGQRLLLDTALEVMQQQSRRVSMHMLRYDGDHWQTYDPGGETGAKLAAIRQEWLADDYAQQKQLLDQLHEKTGDDVYVAAFSRMTRKDSDETSSFATWSKGVDTLIPECDLVVLLELAEGGSGIKAKAVLPWKEAYALVGSLMERTDMMPARYRVRTFPEEALFATLVAKSVM
jgi:hypothetical protein